MSGIGHSIDYLYNYEGTGDTAVDGVLSGLLWDDPTIEYSFPGNASEYGTYYYYGAGESYTQYEISGAMQAVARFALDSSDGNSANDGFSVAGFTAQNIEYTTSWGAHIRISQTGTDAYGFGTAWSYYPYTNNTAGDVWFYDGYYDYSDPTAGDYAYLTMIHELGHSFGLKHPHSDLNFDPSPEQYDSMEYSVMSYKSYVGTEREYYTNAQYSYAQTYMMLDIRALQHLYGANFSVNSGDTTYSWTPSSGRTYVNGQTAIAPGGNTIFATIWDGGGTDTYDLGAYSTDLLIDLAPGSQSVFDDGQLADLGDGHSASGNIYNALQYQGSSQSLIENAIGGKGDDKIWGNTAGNALIGGSGNDILKGFGGDDTLEGKADNDNLQGGDGQDDLSGNAGNDELRGNADADILKGGGGNDSLFGGLGDDILNGGSGADLLAGQSGSDVFRFLTTNDAGLGARKDTISDFKSGQDRIDLSRLTGPPLEYQKGGTFSGEDATVLVKVYSEGIRLFIDTDADGTADMQINLTGVYSVTQDDFLL